MMFGGQVAQILRAWGMPSGFEASPKHILGIYREAGAPNEKVGAFRWCDFADGWLLYGLRAWLVTTADTTCQKCGATVRAGEECIIHSVDRVECMACVKARNDEGDRRQAEEKAAQLPRYLTQVENDRQRSHEKAEAVLLSDSFADQVAALGPRPMPRPGVWSPEAHDWHRRYLAIFNSCSGEFLHKSKWQPRPFVHREKP
jgi:hypothetical protein